MVLGENEGGAQTQDMRGKQNLRSETKTSLRSICLLYTSDAADE